MIDSSDFAIHRTLHENLQLLAENRQLRQRIATLTIMVCAVSVANLLMVLEALK